MVTAVTVTGFANSAVASAQAQPAPPVLSELAQATLDRLGRMHSAFADSQDAVSRRALDPGPGAGAATAAGGGADLAGSVASVSAAFRDAARLQAQIVQFSMATSISQSLGNNLNSFLKGS